MKKKLKKMPKGGSINKLEGDLYSKVLLNRNRDKEFVNRAYGMGQYPNQFGTQTVDFNSQATHLMGWGEDDNGQSYMYPTIFNPNNDAVKVPNQYADYISSEGYKNETGLGKQQNGGIMKKKGKSKLKKAQFGVQTDEPTFGVGDQGYYEQNPIVSNQNNALDFMIDIQNPSFNPALTSSLQNYNKKQKNQFSNSQPYLTPEEQLQYNNYNKKPKLNINNLQFTPLTGNKYLNKGFNYLNQAINHGSNITFKNGGKLPMYAPGGINMPNMYQGINYQQQMQYPQIDNYDFDTQRNNNTIYNPLQKQGINLPQINSAPNYQQSIETPQVNAYDFYDPTPEEQKQSSQNQQNNPQFNQSNLLNGIGAATNTIQAGINFGKGALDMIGSQRQNQQAQRQESQLYSQSVFSQNLNNMPEDYIYNRNQLAENGKQIREIGGNGMPSIEVEDKEHILLPNGFSQEISGKTHNEGGIPLNLQNGTKIFSEKLKVETDKGKKSYADIAKPFETKKNVDMLEAKGADNIQKQTADMMIKFKTQKLEEIFNMQEADKMSGLHGKQIAKEAMNETMMENGGMKKAVNGDWMGETFKTPQGRITPTGQDLNANPLLNWEEYRKDWEKLAQEAGQIKKGDRFKNTKELQEFAYDWALDNNPELIKQTYQTYGITNQNEAQYKNKDVNNLSLQDMKDLRGNYIDGFKGKRLFKPITQTTPNTQQTGLNQPVAQNTVQFKDRIQYIQNNPNIDINGLNLAVPLPNIYGRTPLNYYKTEPNYIDPRYLNNQAEVNQINRNQRAFQNNLGSRGTGDIANLLQGQANMYNQLNQVSNQKYAYDRNQDSQVQQYNADAKTRNDQYNQGTWYNQLEMPIRLRESNIGTQELMDNKTANENLMLSNQYYNSKNYIENTFNPTRNFDPSMLGTFGSNNADINDNFLTTVTYDKRGNVVSTKKPEKKSYGGKVTKIKPKIKKK